MHLFEPTGNGNQDPRIRYEENTADEILDGVMDFMSFTELSPEQRAFNR